MMERVRRGSRVVLGVGDALLFSVDGGPQALPAARAELRERFGSKLGSELCGVAQLLLSELVANCVRHGAATQPGTGIDITASLFRHVLRIEVSDGAPTFRYEARPISPDELSGRGLRLVHELSSRWGISDRRPASVWFELQRS
jgi:serine/threonine-protein kinase RsbW